MNSAPVLRNSVTVVIPCRNIGRHLPDTLRSIARQEYPPFRVVLSCNGFTPTRTEIEMCRSIIPIDVGISSRNLTIGDSWNFAVSLVDTDWVHILHDDDWVDSQFYRAHFISNVSTSDSSIWFSGTMNHYEDLSGTTNLSQHELGQHPTNNAISKFLFEESASRCVSTILRTDAFRKTGGFDSRLKQFVDIDLFWRQSLIGPVTSSQEILGHYRVHSSSVTGLQAANRRQPALEDGRVVQDIYLLVKKYSEMNILSRHFHSLSVHTCIRSFRYCIKRGLFFAGLNSLYILIFCSFTPGTSSKLSQVQ